MRFESLHILLIEDSETHAAMVRESLCAWLPGLNLSWVRTLEQARALLDRGLPDLAIIDYLLPDGKGTELLAGDERFSLFPSIVITNHGDEQLAVESIKSGALDYLAKSPDCMHEIAFVTQRVLREWAHRQELLRAELARRATEEKYRKLFLNMSEAVAIDEPILDDSGRCVDWKILDVNPAFEQILGIPREQVLGCRSRDAYGPEFDYQAILELFDRIGDGEEPKRVEVYFPPSDRFLSVAVFSLGDGCFATVSSDISGRKRAEAERERLLSELHATINAIAEAVVIYDPEGGIRHMNPAAGDLLQYSTQERGLSLRQRCALQQVEVPSGERQEVELLIRRALAGETLQGVLSKLRTRDGRAIWLSSSLAPILDAGGRVLGAVGTASDITAVHELQKQRDLFLHTISHDLRLPLTVISGYAQLLQEKFKDCEGAADSLQFAEEIILAALKMARMTEDLVDLARLEGGQLVLSCRQVCMAHLVDRLLRSSSRSLAVERVRVDIPADLPSVQVDPDRIERVILNLLSNALKYSPGQSPVNITSRQEGAFLRVEVEDRGVGIAKEAQSRIFEQYFRPDAQRVCDSVGLGLYISRMLVEAHGGQISLRSTPGSGSLFFFTLPL